MPPSIKYPATADSSEPVSTPSRNDAASRRVGERQHADEQAHGEADAAQQGDAEDLRPRRAVRLAANPPITAIQVAPKTPICLPTNSPAAIPSGTVQQFSSDIPCSETPALAKANSGSTPKATQGCRLSSSCSSSDGSPVGLARQRDGERHGNAGQRRMDARLEHAHPD